MSLLRSSAVFSAMTMISRVLGFVRDMVFARFFGVSAATDAFFVAFRIPNVLRRMFAEGSFSMAFVPVLSEIKSRGDQQALREFIDHVAGTLMAVLLVIAGLGSLFAPQLITVLAPGFDAHSGQQELAGKLLQITFPYIFLIALTAFVGAILNTYKRFAIPALAPVFLNICLILAAVFGARWFAVPVYALAWAVTIAGVVQLLFVLPALMRLGVFPRPRLGFKHRQVRKVGKLMVPTLFGASAAQLNILLDTIIATLIAAGSVSWLYYADRLMEFPLGVFGIAFSTVLLPNLSAHFSENNARGFSKSLDWGIETGLLIAIPAAVGLAFAAKPILITLFGYGAFGMDDVNASAWALVAYASGLPGFVMVKILAVAFFSRQDTKTPVKTALLALGVNLAGNIVLAWSFIKAGLAYPHTALAIASSMAAYVNAGLLFYYLKSDAYFRTEKRWLPVIVRQIVGAMALGVLLWWLTKWFIGMSADVWVRAGQLAAIIAVSVLLWGMFMWVLGYRPTRVPRQ